MRIEDELTQELRAHADALRIPSAPVDRLVRRGEHARTVQRRRRTALLAAAAVLAVLVAAGTPLLLSRSPHSSPAPTHHMRTPHSIRDLPRGGPPAVAYLQAGKLHAPGLTLPAPGNLILAAGHTVIVGRGGNGPGQERWWLLSGSRLQPIPALDGVASPKVSPSGDLVAWSWFPNPQTTRVTAWDPRTQQEVAHVDLAAPFNKDRVEGGQQVQVWGIDRQDAVYFANSGGPPQRNYLWHPGHGAPTTIAGAPETIGVTPLGPVLNANSPRKLTGRFGEVGASGRFRALGTLPRPDYTVWAPDGSEYVDSRGVAVDASTRRHTRLSLPRGLLLEPLIFESGHDVLIEAEQGHQKAPRQRYVVRCDTDSGRCELALRLGKQDDWTFPGLP